jgi:hypothetical protein
MSPHLYTTWVWSDESHDWRAVKHKQPWQRKYRRNYLPKVARKLLKREKKKGRIATARPSKKGKPMRAPKGKSFMSASAQKWALINQWLSGDLDANLDLMYAIAQVARDDKTPLYIAEGSRSLREQWRLWALKKAGKIPWPVAFPGTSNHTDRANGALAADVREGEQRGTPNIGDSKNRRKLMAKYGLCLPVLGEKWHVEFGNNWRA